MNGVLVIDKPAGPTSFDVVRRVRSLLRVKKAGHTGTLDPLATGVLPLCLGDATKIAGFITEGDKAYTAVIRLGVETDTQDAQGKIVSERPVPALGREALEAAVAGFRGKQLQTPPMYSAIKVGGRRLYEMARAGEEVERAPREVTVHALELVDFKERELTLEVRCSKGFFVRTLAADLGQKLGCGAHLKALRRTQSGPFTLQQAIGLDRLEADLERGSAALAEVERRLVSLSDALAELPAFPVSPSLADKILHGLPIEASPRVPDGRVRVVDASGRLLAVAEVGPTRRLRYLRVLS
jgi:tRNA pseudouridine55 synthase